MGIEAIYQNHGNRNQVGILIMAFDEHLDIDGKQADHGEQFVVNGMLKEDAQLCNGDIVTFWFYGNSAEGRCVTAFFINTRNNYEFQMKPGPTCPLKRLAQGTGEN